MKCDNFQVATTYATMTNVKDDKLGNLVVTTVTTSVSKDIEFINTSVELSAGCHYSNTDHKVMISLINSDDCIPSAMKKLKLDVKTILMREKLSDLHINTVQKILKIQFPAINGLESTLYQVKERLNRGFNQK